MALREHRVHGEGSWPRTGRVVLLVQGRELCSASDGSGWGVGECSSRTTES